MGPHDLAIDLVKIPVTNVDRSVAFYRDVVGLNVDFQLKPYGWVQMSINGLKLALYRPGFGGGTRRPGGAVDFHLQTPSLDDLHGRLRARGANILDGVIRSESGGAFLDVVDPDGNVLRFVNAPN